MKTIFPDDTARARVTDPLTSHEAADSSNTVGSRDWVLSTLQEHGGLAHHELEEYGRGVWSPSRIRTATNELRVEGVVEFAGIYRQTPSRRRAHVWQVAT